MKNIGLLFLILCYSLLDQVAAQNVTVAGASTGNGTYATLGAAFTAINAGSQAGATITISITANTTEGSTATLSQSSGVWSSLSITPSGNRTVQGNLGTLLIDLDGADNVTIDGLNDGVNSLVIDNTNNGASLGTIRLNNDATSNTLTNCTFKGSSTNVNSAVILFGTGGAAAQGNDNNTITNCIIKESSGGYPRFGIQSNGSNSPATKLNSGNTVSNNQFINVVVLGISGAIAADIQLTNASNTDWTISNNSFYFSASMGSTQAANNYGIRITGNSGTNFLITGNYFGGSGINCSGTPMTWNNTTNGNKFCAISIASANSGTASSIQGNTIQNISLNTNSSANTSPYVFCGIDIENGLVNVGTTTGNLIGSTTNTGSILVNVSTNPNGYIVGINSAGTATTPTISNNVLSGITVTNPSLGTTYVNFRGIYVTAQPATISGNTIGSTTLSQSLQNSTGATSGTICLTTGISITSASGVTATSNTISNLVYTTIPGATNLFQVIGIQATSGTNTLSSNVILNLSNVNQNASTGSSASVIGISDVSGISSGETISQNEISNISNTNSGSVLVHVYGILAGCSGSNHSISKNKIYDLKFSSISSSTSTGLDGIRITTGTPTISNNMISIGNGLTNNPYINAINIQGGTPALYYNSVVVTGAAAGAANFTNCLRIQGGSNGTIIQDNILHNDRTSANNANNESMFFTSTTQRDNVTTCNYNDLYINPSNTVTVTVTGGASSPYSNLTNWQTNSGGRDLNSISVAPSFVNIANDLHLTADCSISGKANALGSITIDYDSQTRSLFPDIGADEYGLASWIGVTSSDWNVTTNWSPNVIPTSTSDVVISNGTPFSCAVLSANASCHSISVLTAASFSIIGNKTLTVNANCTYGGFANNGSFSPGSSSEEVAFNGLGTVLGTVTFNIVSTNNGLTFGTTTTTVNKKFRIDAGGYVAANPPIYTTGQATLQYNTGGTYGRSLEWNATSGAGYPNDVQVSSNTLLDLGNGGTGTARQCAGSVTIDAGSQLSMDNAPNQMTATLTVLGSVTNNGTLSLSSSLGGDIIVKGDWTRGSSATFNHNCRAVFFTSTTSDQTITVTGGGTETFSYVILDKTGRKLLLGSSTDMKISATAGCGLGSLCDYLTFTNGDIDLQGRTLYFEGPTGLSPQLVMNLKVKNGTRTISSSVAGGIVSLSSTLNSKTILVVDGGGSGKLLFGNNVEVKDAAGEIDFGSGNLSTVNYILRINSGGAIVGNAAYYAQNSKLVYSTGTSFDVTSTEYSWKTGTLGTTPGVPWDVEVNAASTDVRISDDLDRCVRNDFSIIAGTFELGAPGFLTCALTIGGDWVRVNSGTSFVPNQNKVIFNSTVNAVTQLQTITITGGGNESYYILQENNSLGLSLSGTTNVYVTDHLYLTIGLVNTSSNEIYVTNSLTSSITFDASNSSADSWVNGYLRRKITTGYYDWPVGTAATASAAGYELMSLDFSSNSNIDNLRVSFTSDNTGTNEPYTAVVSGTPITDRLNAGWWTVMPYNSLMNVISPVCNYNIYLNERGHTNSQISPQQYAVIQRSSNYCYDVCAIPWDQCGVHNNATQTEVGGTAHAERSGFTCNTFSDWAIGFAVTILPIELTTFDVTWNNVDAVLTWLTSAEYNSSFFAVERSLDGVHFSQIGTVQAAGHSVLPKNYSFNDYNVRELGVSKVYYRLRMVDMDQSFEYSEIRMVNIEGSATDDVVIVYPNPFNDNLSILWNSTTDETVTIQLVDVAGRIVIENQIKIAEGANTISLDNIASLANGVYFIHLTSGRQSLSQKLVKSR